MLDGVFTYQNHYSWMFLDGPRNRPARSPFKLINNNHHGTPCTQHQNYMSAYIPALGYDIRHANSNVYHASLQLGRPVLEIRSSSLGFMKCLSHSSAWACICIAMDEVFVRKANMWQPSVHGDPCHHLCVSKYKRRPSPFNLEH